MSKEALKAFIHEYRLRGTPSILLIDRQGRIRFHHFGLIDDLKLGSTLGLLVAETDIKVKPVVDNKPSANETKGCDENPCSSP